MDDKIQKAATALYEAMSNYDLNSGVDISPNEWVNAASAAIVIYMLGEAIIAGNQTQTPIGLVNDKD